MYVCIYLSPKCIYIYQNSRKCVAVTTPTGSQSQSSLRSKRTANTNISLQSARKTASTSRSHTNHFRTRYKHNRKTFTPKRHKALNLSPKTAKSHEQLPGPCLAAFGHRRGRGDGCGWRPFGLAKKSVCIRINLRICVSISEYTPIFVYTLTHKDIHTYVRTYRTLWGIHTR